MGKGLFIVVSIIFFMVGILTAFAKSAEAPRMPTDELKAMLGSPDLVIVDVRYGKDWTDSDVKIKGAVREDPHQLDSWTKKYPQDKTTILYCK